MVMLHILADMMLIENEHHSKLWCSPIPVSTSEGVDVFFAWLNYVDRDDFVHFETEHANFGNFKEI